jgi:hypothetical protein
MLTEPAVTDRQGIGFGWLQNACLAPGLAAAFDAMPA